MSSWVYETNLRDLPDALNMVLRGKERHDIHHNFPRVLHVSSGLCKSGFWQSSWWKPRSTKQETVRLFSRFVRFHLLFFIAFKAKKSPSISVNFCFELSRIGLKAFIVGSSKRWHRPLDKNDESAKRYTRRFRVAMHRLRALLKKETLTHFNFSGFFTEGSS